ncbi:hypothetical protein LGK97_06425 [Clostridium sp. CS001]|uniref:hypothetical protein n=1 Tax=Clostridium sp. CS001 TaxID=2880648 RepID=UPI001CF54D10|nr:hypothetical protein [Clostridium sp. CS001]MCB2289401.1 hypothetical protein [Clostridium sp. CS001]
MSFPLSNLDAGQLLVAANALAISFSKGLTSDEIELLSSFITSVGDLLGLIASRQEIIEDKESN